MIIDKKLLKDAAMLEVYSGISCICLYFFQKLSAQLYGELIMGLHISQNTSVSHLISKILYLDC